MQYYFENYNRAPLDIYIMDYPKLIVSNWKEESISIQRVKHCVNFSGSKPRTPLTVRAASLAIQKSMANMFGLISWYM